MPQPPADDYARLLAAPEPQPEPGESHMRWLRRWQAWDSVRRTEMAIQCQRELKRQRESDMVEMPVLAEPPPAPGATAALFSDEAARLLPIRQAQCFHSHTHAAPVKPFPCSGRMVSASVQVTPGQATPDQAHLSLAYPKVLGHDAPHPF